ncbi:hypothetical protein ACVWW2_008174 [Bradyrhizobium sp. LM4.3]
MIEKAGPEGGYGKYIRIKHNNGYETAYGHMSAFAKGMEPGKKVRQGQVIGFVGSTGASTGPHVHYEILVNGRFVDPLRVKLPRGRSLEGPMLAGFEKERDRLDGMMSGRAGAIRKDVGRNRRAAPGHQPVAHSRRQSSENRPAPVGRRLQNLPFCIRFAFCIRFGWNRLGREPVGFPLGRG